ncbi:DUF1236 domain-containing protein [Roseovarius nitratireducens]|uniref:DUF1236 domain-containing protein n=1 Tax=Roseovarius nitratireducens TaxID=2044597 RepID=UPI000CE24BA8|nr:DUF1236 domain-containing protein [Roseovarius nitratireducens]
MSIKISLGATVAGLLVATSAYAETTATAWTDLNLRTGPGPMYEITTVIPATEAVTVDGCLEASSWCRVNYAGTDGWASGDYLTAMIDDAQVPIYVNRERIEIPSVAYDDKDATTAAGGATGAVAGALVGGPVGALVGGAIGLGVGAMATPDERVTTYVRSNPVDPVYLDGEVVVGAGIPETVTLREVPDSEYYYTYVNGVPVIVEREERRVVHIVR